MEFMQHRDVRGLAFLARSERQSVSAFLGRLWDPSPEYRQMAAQALGVAATAHPDLVIEIVRRLIWALNDEAATNGRYGIAALGEIGFHNPKLIEPFVGPMASYLWDPDLREELLRALLRIADAAPELVRDAVDPDNEFFNNDTGEVRRLVGELKQCISGGQNGS